MARPLRIEFPGAWYHVMNRGAGYRTIFLDDTHRELFLALLADVHERFGVAIHAYCLMDNHYHLLVQTPEGNLGRAMRHLNGVYTQRINRSAKSDGPLFRGRYKAILVEADSYLLQVSRYIHRNPLEAGQVPTSLIRYPWSSYPAYVGKVSVPTWLTCSPVLVAVGGSIRRYRAFVECSVDEELNRFYGQGKLSPILGSQPFKQQILADHDDPRNEIADRQRVFEPVPAERILQAVATEFGLTMENLLVSRRGRADGLPRMVAMALCQAVGRMKLADIASHFGLTSYTSASSALSRVRAKLITHTELQATLQRLTKDLMTP